MNMRSDEKPIVRYRNIRKSYGDLEVIKGSISIFPAEKIAVIGPSGSGKTTLGRMLMTLEEPSSGTIEVDGELLWHKKVNGKLVRADEKHLHKIRGKIGMVFQHFNLFPHMTILRNVTEAPVRVKGMSRKEAEKIGMEMLDKVGLIDKKDNYPSQLSGDRSSGWRLPARLSWIRK